MTEPKLITDGPKKGGYRIICVNCGHIEYRSVQQAQANPGPSPIPTAPAQAHPQQPGQPRKPVIFTG